MVVYDVLGRAVQTVLAGTLGEGTHRAALDVAALAPGAYVVRATVVGGRGANTGGGVAVRTARLTVTR